MLRPLSLSLLSLPRRERPLVGRFELSARVMDDTRFGRTLHSDFAIVTQLNRAALEFAPLLAELGERTSLRDFGEQERLKIYHFVRFWITIKTK